jgi:hypothetical protein
MPKNKNVLGSREWAVCRPSVRNGEPDRVQVWDRLDMRSKEFAMVELQSWLDEGQQGYLVSRQWEKGEPEYEYNLRVDGKIFYDTWCDEDMILGLWDSADLDEVKSRLRPGWILIRRVKSEIEEV